SSHYIPASQVWIAARWQAQVWCWVAVAKAAIGSFYPPPFFADAMMAEAPTSRTSLFYRTPLGNRLNTPSIGHVWREVSPLVCSIWRVDGAPLRTFLLRTSVLSK